MNEHPVCTICGGENTMLLFPVKDYSVSHEDFDIAACRQCCNRFTANAPSQYHIGRYYAFEDYISHTDTQKGLINSLYHRVRKFTLRSKVRLVNRVSALKTGDLLDVGAGTGAFLQAMQEAGWKTTGLEPDEGARKKAAELYGLALKPSDELYGLQTGSFDVITLWHVLEHVHDIQKYLDTFLNLLKPGGRLIIAVPNFTSRDAMHYHSCWAAYDVPRHLYHFSPEGMEYILKKHGFQLLEQLPMWFDSFYVSMLSEKYKNNGVSNHVKAGLMGLLSNLKAWNNVSACSSVIYVSGKIN